MNAATYCESLMRDASTLCRLEKLFDLQMWAFGCDARHPGGNLFSARGMNRKPPAAGSGLSSTWCEARGPAAIELCSGGVHVRVCSKHLFLQRGHPGPQLRACSAELLPTLVDWVLEWEDWVDLKVGPEWRPATLTQRRRPSLWSAADMRAQWRVVVRLMG